MSEDGIRMVSTVSPASTPCSSISRDMDQRGIAMVEEACASRYIDRFYENV
jgi:hypothetical protein